MNKNIWIFSHDFYPIKWWQWTHIYNIYNQLKMIWFEDFLIFSPLINKLSNHITIFNEDNNSKLKNILFSFKIFRNIKNIIKENNLWLLHFHWWPWGLFFFKKMNIPIIFTAHHTYWQQYNYVKWQKWKKIFYYFEKLSYKNADKIICVSEDTKNILKEKYNIAENKLIYIPNWINLDEFQIDENIEKEKNSLVFIWRLDERKWIEFLLESMKLIVKKDCSIKLYVIWDWKLRKKLENFIGTNWLEKNIIFTWKLSWGDLKQKIQECEIMITPSVFEWFWISVLEWMVLKIPVIWTNVDWIRTIIKDWKNWILVDYWNKKHLKNEIVNLLNNKQLQEKIIKNAYNDLDKMYNWNLITKYTINEYKKLV